ncbi:hypothetical protein AAHE18_03G168200 [Arachis hypogaea]
MSYREWLLKNKCLLVFKYSMYSCKRLNFMCNYIWIRIRTITAHNKKFTHNNISYDEQGKNVLTTILQASTMMKKKTIFAPFPKKVNIFRVRTKIYIWYILSY